MTHIEQYRNGDRDTDSVRIMIVEDHPLFGQGLRRVLEGESDFRVIAEVEDGAYSVDRALGYFKEIIIPTESGAEDGSGQSIFPSQGDVRSAVQGKPWLLR